MRDRDYSIPLPRIPQPVNTIQIYLGNFSLQLIVLKRQLGKLADLIDSESGGLLPAELANGIATVRSDLLTDAISTLNVLAQMSEGDISRRFIELADLQERLTDA